MQNNLPLVSVIIPVYNGEAYLADAIKSILAQTYRHFELFLLCEYDTNEESSRIADSFSDTRVRVIKNTEKLGLPATLNKGVDLAAGKYVARMDADDIALSHRLETQVRFMETHPEIDIAGSYAKTVGRKEGVVMRNPLSHEEIRANLLFHSSMIHPTVMMRKSALDTQGLRYDPTLKRTEDYEFWYRASKSVCFATIPKVLLYYRTHENQATHQDPELQRGVRDMICTDAFGRLGIPLSEEERELYERLRLYRRAETAEELAKILEWLRKIKTANLQTKIYEPGALGQVLAHEALTYCRLSSHLGKASWHLFRDSGFLSHLKKDFPTLARLAKFFFQSLSKN